LTSLLLAQAAILGDATVAASEKSAWARIWIESSEGLRGCVGIERPKELRNNGDCRRDGRQWSTKPIRSLLVYFLVSNYKLAAVSVPD
jgi:hypothetical protein